MVVSVGPELQWADEVVCEKVDGKVVPKDGCRDGVLVENPSGGFSMWADSQLLADRQLLGWFVLGRIVLMFFYFKSSDLFHFFGGTGSEIELLLESCFTCSLAHPYYLRWCNQKRSRRPHLCKTSWGASAIEPLKPL